MKTLTIELEEYNDLINKVESLKKKVKEVSSETYSCITVNGYKEPYPSTVKIEGYNVPKKLIDFLDKKRESFEEMKTEYKALAKKYRDERSVLDKTIDSYPKVKRLVKSNEKYLEMRMETLELVDKLDVFNSNIHLFSFSQQKKRINDVIKDMKKVLQ